MRNKLTIVLDEASINLKESLVNFSCVYIFKCSCGWNTNVNISVNELNKFIEANNIINCIVVASSLGVFTALTYANKYPQKIIGLVLLDPSHQNQGISALSILNTYNIPFSPELEDLKCFFSSTNEMSETGATEINKINTLHKLPLLILAAGDLKFPNVINNDIKQKLIEDRHKMLQEYCKLSENSKFMIISNVGHGIAFEKPKEVAQIINEYFLMNAQ